MCVCALVHVCVHVYVHVCVCECASVVWGVRVCDIVCVFVQSVLHCVAVHGVLQCVAECCNLL